MAFTWAFGWFFAVDCSGFERRYLGCDRVRLHCGTFCYSWSVVGFLCGSGPGYTVGLFAALFASGSGVGILGGSGIGYTVGFFDTVLPA